MSRFRTYVAEAILADVLDELTRLGAFVEGLQIENGQCMVTGRSDDGKVAEFERWLAIFTKGASRVDSVDK